MILHHRSGCHSLGRTQGTELLQGLQQDIIIQFLYIYIFFFFHFCQSGEISLIVMSYLCSVCVVVLFRDYSDLYKGQLSSVAVNGAAWLRSRWWRCRTICTDIYFIIYYHIHTLRTATKIIITLLTFKIQFGLGVIRWDDTCKTVGESCISSAQISKKTEWCQPIFIKKLIMLKMQDIWFHSFINSIFFGLD